jgi:hypothetical protein
MICAVDQVVVEPVESSARRSREHWVVLALCVIAPLGLAGMGAFLVPSANGHGTHEQLGLPPCRMIEWFGIPCPGCGVTTSVTLAAQGHLLKAFVTQPFGIVMFALGVAALPWALWIHFRGRDAYAELQRCSQPKMWIVFFALMTFGWIWKLFAVLAT